MGFKMKKKAAKASSINSLPQDLVVEVLTQLISASTLPLLNLKNLRMTCKEFHEASKARRVELCVPVIDKVWRLDGWNDATSSFPAVCHLADVGNLEACFILGLIRVYEGSSEESGSGMEYLNKAIAGGHQLATYATGIMLFGEPTTRNLGMELLSRTNDINAACRREVASFMSSISWKGIEYWCRNPKCGGSLEDWSHQSFCNLRCRLRYEREHRWRRTCSSSCANPKCGHSSWSGPTRFCSQSCRWRHEYLQLYKMV